MIRTRLCFEDGSEAVVFLAARPLTGEFIEHEGDRYRVKDVHHVSALADTGNADEPVLVVKLGIGRKGSHRHLLERSARGFYTGSD